MRYPVLLLLVANLILNCRDLHAQSSKSLRVVLDSASDVSGRISRDGKWLSYTDWNTGDLNIREISSGKTLKLTKGPGDLSEYAGISIFSPKGNQVAFLWYGDSTQIRVVSLSADTNQLVTTDADLLDWSPDGQSLLVFKKGQLGYVQIATGEFRSLVNMNAHISHASVSPGGDFLAFATMSSDPTRYEMQIVSTSNGKQQTFVSGKGNHQAPVWTLDGKNLIYLSDRGNVLRVWQKSLKEQNPHKGGHVIAELPDAAAVMLGIDRKGTVYLGTYDRGGQDVYYGTVDWEKRAVANLRKIPSPPFHGSRRALFSASGDSIAFMQKGRGYTVRPGWQTPVVRNLLTGAVRQYPTRLTLRDEPLWSSNGKALYFTAPPEGGVGEDAGRNWSFYRLDLNSGSYSIIGNAEIAGQVRMVGATADSILYLVNTFSKPNTGSIFSFDVISGKSHLLHQVKNSSLSDAALSPDGSRLVFVMNEADGSRSLHVLTKGEKIPAQITTLRPNARAQLMWLPSGKEVITSGRIKGKQGIWKVPLDGSSPEALNISADNVTEVRLSADGRKIAFTRTNQLPLQVLALTGTYSKH